MQEKTNNFSGLRTEIVPAEKLVPYAKKCVRQSKNLAFKAQS
jgi:hypothetical protein